jgi:hypothetical protein
LQIHSYHACSLMLSKGSRCESERTLFFAGDVRQHSEIT